MIHFSVVMMLASVHMNMLYPFLGTSFIGVADMSLLVRPKHTGMKIVSVEPDNVSKLVAPYRFFADLFCNCPCPTAIIVVCGNNVERACLAEYQKIRYTRG